MDDLLLLIHGLMKIALLTGIMVLVATAPSRAAAAAGHGLPGSLFTGLVGASAAVHRNSGSMTDSFADSEPAFNIDGTVMLGAFDMNGNAYGFTQSHDNFIDDGSTDHATFEADPFEHTVNIDGTPMCGDIDIHGNFYGVTDWHTDSGTAACRRRACSTDRSELPSQGLRSSYGSTPKATASLSMLSSEMFRTCRSTWATKVLCSPASKASASWESSLVLRSETTFAASRARALTLFFA
jgi:hypothetical protein